MEVRRAESVLFVTPNLAAMISLAGAIADDDSGVINVYSDTTVVTAHFFFSGQLRSISTCCMRGENEKAERTSWDSMDPRVHPNPP